MDLALNNLQWLIGEKTNQAKPNPAPTHRIYSYIHGLNIAMSRNL